jgi:hypothetical protein
MEGVFEALLQHETARQGFMSRRCQRAMMRGSERLARAFVHFIIMLSVWRAPLPWIHWHADDHGSGAASSNLREHVAAFHHGGEAGEEGLLHGLHWHVAFLDDIARGGGSPKPGDGSEPSTSYPDSAPCTPDHPTVNCGGLADAPASFAGLASLAAFPIGTKALPPEHRITQPLAAFLAAGELLSLLCIARC